MLKDNNKYMKKTIVMAVIIGSMLVGSTTYALASYKWAENTDFTVLQNNFTDGENVKVATFKQGSTTCFMLTSKVTNEQARGTTPTSVSISCVK